MVETIKAYKSSSGKVYMVKSDALREDLESMLTKTQAITPASATKLLDTFIEDRRLANDFGNMLAELISGLPDEGKGVTGVPSEEGERHEVRG